MGFSLGSSAISSSIWTLMLCLENKHPSSGLSLFRGKRVKALSWDTTISSACWGGWVDYSPILGPEAMSQPLNANPVTWYLDWNIKLRQVPVTSASVAEALTTEHPLPHCICVCACYLCKPLNSNPIQPMGRPDHGHAFWFGWITDSDRRFAFETNTNLNPISHIIVLFSYFLISASHLTPRTF